MKWLIFLLCLPVVPFAQTIHFDDENIVYEGTEMVPGVKGKAILSQLPSAIAAAQEKKTAKTEVVAGKNKVVSTGEMKLKSPFPIIRKVHYRLAVSPNEDGYSYHIDSVYVTEKRRGGKTETKNAEELLEGMEETGNVAIETEKVLNEIDMHFQKLLALLARRMRLSATENYLP
jgi:hypothetical protein